MTFGTNGLFALIGGYGCLVLGQENNSFVANQDENDYEQNLERGDFWIGSEYSLLQASPERTMDTLSALTAVGYGPRVRVATVPTRNVKMRATTKTLVRSR